MSHCATHSASPPLPVMALLALAMTGFICIVTETLPAGLLPQISDGLGISQALAGQMITVYALGSLLAAIPLTIATQSWRRRNVLLLTIVGFLVFNSMTALSSHFVLTLVARFFAGVAAGLAWSLLAGYARRMVAPHQQGKAMALAMVGTPIALSLGEELIIYPHQGSRYTVTRNSQSNHDSVRQICRTPAGHPEGYLEGFAQIYREAATKIRGGEAPLLPGITEGLSGMRFIELMRKSSESDGKWLEW